MMRPVERGSVPVVNGKPKTFSCYQDARRDLIERLGEYCSYCEMRLGASLAVEHIQPKTRFPELETEWSNLLLSCQNCNSTKGKKKIALDDYYWPDRDNTARAIEYLKGGRVRPNPSLSAPEQTKAKATIDLTGLDPDPDENGPTAADRRWNNRRQAWKLAVRAKERLAENDYPAMRAQIAETAESRGFWSVWMTVFAEDADMRQRFIRAFPGTAQDCFDAACSALHRPGGKL